MLAAANGFTEVMKLLIAAGADVTLAAQNGKKAFEGYLGSVDAGKAHDAVELINGYAGAPFPLLVDQGAADNFLTGDVNQLQPAKLEEACKAKGIDLTLRMQPGYDHSYFFISSFIEDHVNFHADALAK